jgi:ABC-type glycerol-3-phosphate transport system substrate-binding protein
MGGAAIAWAVGLSGGAHPADSKEVQMLHWWTSGGEAAALSVVKDYLAKEGYAWKDVPVAGGGEAAMTTLKAMVAAGNPPTASQTLGYFALDYAEAGKLGDVTSLAEKGGWAKVIPTALQKFTTTDGKWDAVPINIHSVNWIWVNKAIMDKIGGTALKNFDEFVALLDKAKKAGVIPLALGGQPWREATLFDSVVMSTGGPDFYKKAFIDLDDSALKSDTMKTSFDNLAKLRDYVDPNFAGRDWNLATAMVIKGDTLLQVMGDWRRANSRSPIILPISANADESRLSDGAKVIFGIRPEAVNDKDGVDRGARSVATFDAQVEIVEPAGSDTFVVTRAAGKELTARVRADTQLRISENHTFAFNLDKAVLFYPQTSRRI